MQNTTDKRRAEASMDIRVRMNQIEAAVLSEGFRLHEQGTEHETGRHVALGMGRILTGFSNLPFPQQHTQLRRMHGSDLRNGSREGYVQGCAELEEICRKHNLI